MDFDLITEVAEKLEILAVVEGSAAVGFDGFTDEIVRVVRGVSPDRVPLHFESKRAFGEKIVELDASNASFDLTEVAIKIGGNAPNTAHALGRLGLQVDCIGMLGYPRVQDLFAAMDTNCALHSFAEPTRTTALEFDDGKVLLASSALLDTVDWPMVRDRIGIERFIDIYRQSDILGFVNWGEISLATEIWEGIEREVLAKADPQKSRLVVFDLSDPTKRDRDFDRLVALIGRLSDGHETILCLNRNEARAVARQLSIEPGSRPEELGAAIYAAITVDTLVIRDPHSAMAWTSKGLSKASTFYVPAPRLSTGGGDNFNAGYCFARLAGLDTQSSLVVASAVAGLYVTTGGSPSRSDVVAFLRQQSAAGRSARLVEAAQ